jgi:predicted DNA-binding protein with PD1-like motif
MVTKKVGQVEEAQWQYVSDQLTEVRPTLEDQSEVLSFREYLDRFFPQKSA